MGTITNSKPSWSLALPYIKLKICDDGSEALQLAHEETPVVLDLASDLLVFYLVDEGSYFSYLNNGNLYRQGVSAEDLHVVAIENLLALARS